MCVVCYHKRVITKSRSDLFTYDVNFQVLVHVKLYMSNFQVHVHVKLYMSNF